MKHGKKYVDGAKLIERSRLYDTQEALDLCVKTGTAKFDETVEVHVKLGVDGRHADQQVRGAIVLPHGTSKTVRVLAICKPEKEDEARAAGAEFVGGNDMIQKIQSEGWMDFDVLITTPDMMGMVGRLGKILGPRGLMPNPKLGTVTTDVAKAIKELKGGRVEYRADRYGIAHVVLGKASFTAEQLAENYGTVYDEVLRMKPAAAKGKYVKSISVSSTMSPGVAVDSSVTRAYTEAAE